MSVTTASIVIENLTVRFKQNTVLDNISLSLHPGSITGLLGPSGAGKTTMMRAIVGLAKSSSGQIRVLERYAGARALRHHIGYVTQSPAVYDDLSVLENLRYFGKISGSAPKRVDEVIDRVEMDEYAHRKVNSLSGGQKARVSLAVALVNDPEVLILDEPTVGLDPLLRKKLWEYFRELASEGKTLLISSHVMDEAYQCDEIVLMREGRILAHDSIAKLRAYTGKDDMNDIFIDLVERTS